MNDLHDLRRTLDAYAADLRSDLTTVERSSAVHHRVRVVRRRRRTAAAGVLAVAVVATGVGVATRQPGDNAQPARRLFGEPVPEQMSALGFTYDLAQVVDGGTAKASVRLPASSQPRLVSWATSGGDQAVTVDGPSLLRPVPFDTPDFGDFTYVPPGAAATVTASASTGDTGLAVYTVGADRPAGVTRDGITFRRTEAGSHLLGAQVGSAGQSELTVPATADGPGVSAHYFCAGGPADAYLHIDYLDPAEGGFVEGGGCDEAAPVDAAGSGSAGAPTSPGENVGMRLYVTAGRHGPRVQAPDLRLGLGLYGLDEDPTGPDGFVPALVEDDGHVWRRESLQRSAPGQTSLTTTAPSGPTPVLAIVLGGGTSSRASIAAQFGRYSSIGFSGGGATQEVVGPETPTRVYVDGGRLGPQETLGVAFYVEVR